MTRGQRIAVRRGQHRRRTAYVRPEFEIVISPAESLGAALARWRREPKWKRRLASGYWRDRMGELLGDPEEAPIILLRHEDAPVPDFIRDYWRSHLGKLKTFPAVARSSEDIEREIQRDTKMFYRIANTLGDFAAAEREMREMFEHPMKPGPWTIRSIVSEPTSADVEIIITPLNKEVNTWNLR